MTLCDPYRSSEFNLLHSFHQDYPALIERCLLAECHYSLVKNILQNRTVCNNSTNLFFIPTGRIY